MEDKAVLKVGNTPCCHILYKQNIFSMHYENELAILT